MPAPTDTSIAEHYTWGDTCDAWYLVRTPTLHVIEELMPPGASETPHHHTHARQFFYVLTGELTIVVEDHAHTLRPHQGLEIAPGEIHQAINRSENAVRFLVTSNPPSHGDRINTPGVATAPPLIHPSSTTNPQPATSKLTSYPPSA